MRSKLKRVSNLLDAHFYTFLDIFILASIILAIILFILYPMLCVIKESFFPDGIFSLKIYRNLFGKNAKLFYNSIFIALFTTIISAFISVCTSLYIGFQNSRVKKILLSIVMLIMISPPFVSSLAYINLFGRRGYITHDILGLTLNTYGWQGIIAMEALGFAPLNILILAGIISGIDKSLIQSSLDLGADSSYTIRRIVLPLMKPGIYVISLLTFVKSLADFGTPIIIGGSFNVLATQAYLSVIAYSDLPMAAAISVMIFIPALIVFFFYRRFMKDSNILSTGGTKSKADLDTKLSINGCLGCIVGFTAFFFLLVMLLQYASIFLSAITKYSYGKMLFTMDHIKQMSLYSGKSFLRSIAYSFITGILGSIIGFLVAYYLEIRKLRFMKAFDFIATMPYIIPGTFFGIGYILAFKGFPFELTGTALIVILNCIFKQLPMPTKVNSAVLSQINMDIASAAKDLGAKSFFVMKDIVFLMAKSAFLISFINNFTATMTTIGSIIFLIYPGRKLATFEMFDAIQSGDYGVGSVIACAIILITLIINLSFSKLVLEDKNVSEIK